MNNGKVSNEIKEKENFLRNVHIHLRNSEIYFLQRF